MRKILKQYKDANLWRLLKDGIDRLIKLSKAGSLMLKTMEFWCKILLLIEQQQHGWICSLPGQICTVCVPRPSHFYLPRPCIELLPLSACHCSEPLSRVSRSGREVLPPVCRSTNTSPRLFPAISRSLLTSASTACLCAAAPALIHGRRVRLEDDLNLASLWKMSGDQVPEECHGRGLPPAGGAACSRMLAVMARAYIGGRSCRGLGARLGSVDAAGVARVGDLRAPGSEPKPMHDRGYACSGHMTYFLD